MARPTRDEAKLWSKIAGRILRKKREEKGWTRRQLAVVAGLTQPEVALLETGGENWNIVHLSVFGATFGCSPAVFMDTTLLK